MNTEPATPPASRRTVLMGAGGLAMGLSTLGFLSRHLVAPARGPAPKGLCLPDIQFDIGQFMPPPQTFNDGGGNVSVGLPPRSTVFVTAKLNRNPNQDDQLMLSEALDTIEQHYRFGPGGIFTYIAYGLPYFKRLPSGLVAHFMPRLDFDNSRFVLEEAVPSPTDVSPLNPGIVKQTYNVPVVIEGNDLLFTFRSDESQNISDVLAWLGGSNRLNGSRVPSPGLFNGLATVTSSRVEFAQIGMPRFIADINGLSFAGQVNPDTPMWMGFLDQQVDGSGPPQITTFVGNSSAHITTAQRGDYFDNGSIQHLSHDIQDLAQFYKLPSASDTEGEPFTERVQYMFRSDPIPSVGNTDQFTNGGGPGIFDNVFKGTNDQFNNAAAINTFNGEHRLGHLSGLQRSSRAADGTPMHIRNDGPGFDSMDVPGGANTAKLQFTVFVPTAEFFRVMRINSASLDLAAKFPVDPSDIGLERFLTATRRQNFLVPPRRHRAFPLLEFAPGGNSGS